MILVSQKRVVMSLSFALLCAPTMPTKAYDSSTTNPALVAGLVCAGIAGVCGLIYGLVQAYKKSPEQIAKDAEEALDRAHMYGHRSFHTDYTNTFEQARFGSDLAYVECNFLEPIARKAQEPHIHVDVEEHIDAVCRSINSLEKALAEVKDAVENLKARNKTDQPIYERLVGIVHVGEAELAYLKPYHHRFAEHRAYFVLAAFESKLHGRYKDACALSDQYSTETYQFEKLLLQIARMHDAQNDYPLVKYHTQLRDDIATLERYIRELRYWYANRIAAANQLLIYLVHIRDVIADTPVFKEERERKKEDDARQEMLALRRREVQAQAMMAQAAAQQAQAAAQQAMAAQQQVYLQQACLAQQPTVIVVSNK